MKCYNSDDLILTYTGSLPTENVSFTVQEGWNLIGTSVNCTISGANNKPIAATTFALNGNSLVPLSETSEGNIEIDGNNGYLMIV